MTDRLLREAFERMAQGARERLTLGRDAVGPGYYLHDGKEIPLAVRPSGDGAVRVSDDGAAWTSLVNESYTEHKASEKDAERLARMCALYEVKWDSRTGEIYVDERIERADDAARRVVTAAIALDGWRAWYPPRAPRLSPTELVRSLGVEAQRRGWWLTDKVPNLAALGHRYKILAVLGRDRDDGDQRVFFNADGNDSADAVIERAIGLVLTSKEPLVIAAKPSVAKRAGSSNELHRRVALVPHLNYGTPELVIEAAGRILSAA